MTVDSASTSKKRRSRARVSLRPKPSVPSVNNPPGTHGAIWSGTVRMLSETATNAPVLFRQQCLDVGFLRRLGRVQHVPALAADGVGAQQFVAGRAPDIGGDTVAFGEDFLRLQRGLNDWPAAEDVGFDGRDALPRVRADRQVSPTIFKFSGPALNLYRPFKIPSSTPAGIGGME